MSCSAILLMGGVGERFKSSTPKQFHRLSGKRIYEHTLEQLLKQPFEKIVLVCPPAWLSFVQKEVKPNAHIQIIPGGKTRKESSFLGLQKIDSPYVLIHDAVRPFVSSRILKENIAYVKKFDAVDTCIQTHDTMIYSTNQKKIDQIPKRSQLMRGQTPQTFLTTLIKKAHEKVSNESVTDDCSLILKLGHPVHIVQGEENNIKITSELDLIIAEQLFRLQSKAILPKASIKGKTYIIVGGSGGIGSKIQDALIQEGASPINVSRSSPFFPLDLNHPDAIEKTFQKIHALYGPVDGLINTAGLLMIKSLSNLSNAEIESQIRVNYFGMILCCKHCHIKPGGHILNIASSSFTRGRKDYGIYSSTKAAVVNFTQSLAEERPDLNINVLIPARTRTPMRLKNFSQKTDLLEPLEVAKKALQILQDQTLTGSMIDVKLGVKT